MGRALVLVYLCLLAFSLATCAKTTTKPPPEPELPKEMDNAMDLSLSIDSFMDECNETFRTDMSYIEALNSSGSFPDESDRTSKCFVRCILEKSEVFSEDGAFDPARAQVFFVAQRPGTPEALFRDSTRACSNRNETCMCDRSYQFVKCMMEKGLNKDLL